MRLAANHPGKLQMDTVIPNLILRSDLVVTKLAIASNTAKETLVCGICKAMAEYAVVSKCKHVRILFMFNLSVNANKSQIFCREDIRQDLQSDPDAQQKCPTCFRALTIDLSQPMVEWLSAANSD
ncbi:hypothetical protein BJ742DRAFT_424101 [Cladochytrium replicatum]|nr:hypothetical protein BJ742DRAFT_424101 [Cladochytrium replicatum]